MNAKEAYAYCEEVTAANSKSFYKAFSLLTKEKRKAVWAIYTFCRTVDDIVDEGQDPVNEMKIFKNDFNRFLTKEFNSENPMWVALDDVFGNYEMEEQAFWDLIQGQEMDLKINRYQSLEDLLEYCYHVASSVGLMLLPVLAPGKRAELKEGAIALGYAMQITNILRDIDEDFNRGRIYLPKAIMAKYGLKEEDLRQRVISPEFVKVWEELAVEAESYYRTSFDTIHEYPPSARLPVKGAALIYREILTTIRSKNYNVFGEKHFVSDASKQEILAYL